MLHRLINRAKNVILLFDITKMCILVKTFRHFFIDAKNILVIQL